MSTTGASGGSDGPPGRDLSLFHLGDEVQFAWDTVDTWVRVNRNNPITLDHMRSLLPLLARYLVLSGGKFDFLDLICLIPFPGSVQLRVPPNWAVFPNNSQYHWAGNDAYSIIIFENNGSWSLDSDTLHGRRNRNRLTALFAQCSRVPKHSQPTLTSLTPARIQLVRDASTQWVLFDYAVRLFWVLPIMTMSCCSRVVVPTAHLQV
ncbi:hypothetical protein K469DRAFT_132961 [Zopfia rhizophila CBS 207.26]|uniref:Uncharacterized protein n=1 Tax=Zopfia rhizophila CBS 207.26 TaxID=1314779 RepID=A0A6A6EXV5_9PEZI|nr:hypothetical protein K469DRAFT_132961 [Zopfia rhizophila CBS 207.26]